MDFVPAVKHRCTSRTRYTDHGEGGGGGGGDDGHGLRDMGLKLDGPGLQ
jgi:hypothetical protein